MIPYLYPLTVSNHCPSSVALLSVLLYVTLINYSEFTVKTQRFLKKNGCAHGANVWLYFSTLVVGLCPYLISKALSDQHTGAQELGFNDPQRSLKLRSIKRTKMYASNNPEHNTSMSLSNNYYTRHCVVFCMILTMYHVHRKVH